MPTFYPHNCDTGLATIRAINEEGEPEGPKYRINPEKLKAAWVDIVTNPDLLHIQDWDVSIFTLYYATHLHPCSTSNIHPKYATWRTGVTRLSDKLNKEVRPDEVSHALLFVSPL